MKDAWDVRGVSRDGELRVSARAIESPNGSVSSRPAPPGAKSCVSAQPGPHALVCVFRNNGARCLSQATGESTFNRWEWGLCSQMLLPALWTAHTIQIEMPQLLPQVLPHLHWWGLGAWRLCWLQVRPLRWDEGAANFDESNNHGVPSRTSHRTFHSPEYSALPCTKSPSSN